MQITKETPKESMIQLSPPCECGACSNGCNFGGGTLADEDIIPLANYLEVDEKKLKEKYLIKVEKYNTTKYKTKFKDNGKGFGRCIFFKKNTCSIHNAKPLECKIASGCKEHGQQHFAPSQEQHLAHAGNWLRAVATDHEFRELYP